MLHSSLLKNQAGIADIKKNLEERLYDVNLLDTAVSLTNRRSELLQQIENAQAKRNTASKLIGQYVAEKKDSSTIEKSKEDVKKISAQIKADKEELETIEQTYQNVMLSLPNILDESVPFGKDESENIPIRSWGNMPEFSFPPLSHFEIAERKNLVDFARGVKLSGSRFYVYNEQVARLERKLIDMMLTLHEQAGYKERSVPLIVSDECMLATGQFPKFKDEYYTVERDSMSLIPTAEVPLTNLYRDEILSSAELPLYVCAQTSCFRREAGSAGKDTRGLIRVHQFQKVELVKFVEPEHSDEELEKLTADAERVLQKLQLHYRVILLCSSDTSFSSAKTYDIEVWLPGMKRWLEISSCSNFKDFQARRASIRYKKDKKNTLVHTLNGSGVAAGRLVAALLEYYQTEEGDVNWEKIYSLINS